MHTPTPGWLAANLFKLGREVALSLLGAGLLIISKTLDAGAPAAFYGALAESTDPFTELRQIYQVFGDDYTYLVDHAQPILAWLDMVDPDIEQRLRAATTKLADVDFVGASRLSGGELLGQVQSELIQIGRRRPLASPYYQLDEFIDEVAITGNHFGRAGEGSNLGDLWCATGVRLLAAARIMKLRGKDPDTCTWHGQDPDPVNIALAAINLAAMGLHQVTFEVADGVMTQEWLTGAGGIGHDLLDTSNHAITSKGLSGPDAIELMAAATVLGDYIEIDYERASVARVLEQHRDPHGVKAALARSRNKETV